MLNQSHVACNLVTNFEVALMKKLWQCSVMNKFPRKITSRSVCAQHAAGAKGSPGERSQSPSPHLRGGGGEGYGYT